jgi:putative ABC transport system permease protein
MRVWFDDVRYASRLLSRSPGFSVVAVLTLALGIGANTAVFSLVEGLYLRFLPFPHAERLVMIQAVHGSSGDGGVGSDNFDEWRAGNTVFETMALTQFAQGNFSGPDFGEPERITGAAVSAEFFPLLGVQPELGRWFQPEEQKPGHDNVLILSHTLWQRRFAGRTDIIGRTAVLDGRVCSVAGVMPAAFRFNEGHRSEYWTPLVRQDSGRAIHMYSAYARLKPGVTVDQAQARMSAIARRQELDYADNLGWTVRVVGMRAMLLQVGPLAIFFGVVAVVLLIACANVANLLLARAAGRDRETTVRLALGATRFRLIRLQLAESLLIAAGGTACGMLFAFWVIDYFAAVAPDWLELRSVVVLDAGVFVFCGAVAALAGLLTGVVPAWQSSRTDIGASMRDEGGGMSAGTGVSRSLNVLVVCQIALCTVLLVAAGLLSRSFLRLLRVDPGVRTSDVVSFRMELPGAKYPRGAQIAGFYRDLVEKVGHLPGVISAGAADAIPLAGVESSGDIEIEGVPRPRDWTDMSAAYREVTPGYFRTLGIPLLRGRDFTAADRPGSQPVIIVNEKLVESWFNGREPIGSRIRLGRDGPWQTIVGVVGNVLHAGMDKPPEAETYTPHSQSPSAEMFLVVRTAVPPASVVSAVRRQIGALDRDLPVSQVQTMSEAVSESLGLQRQMATVVSFSGMMALFMAALGLGGVMWRRVAQRTREIGIRAALGADRADLVRMIVMRGLVLTTTGLALGLGGAFAAAAGLSSFLFGVSPRDTTVFAGVAILLLLVSLATSYGPARRASRVDPLVALRHE